MHPSELWHGKGLYPRVLRTVLTPASWLYAAGWQAYLGMYQLGIKRPKRPHRPVVCIGNLVVGGSGKSPMVLHVVEVLRGLGHEVVVSCSGYGNSAAEAAAVAPSGPLSAREWGDEPSMLRWLNPELPLIVGRRRVLAAELCARNFPGCVMVMDDGFQHLPLKKDLSIVLDDPQPDNSRCLPAGPYREPRGNRRRADLVLPGQFRVASFLTGFRTPEGQLVSAESVGTTGPVSYLCALGQPQRFLGSLAAAGIEVGRGVLLPDHDPMTAGNLFDALPAGVPIVVTAKDWVKLRERTDLGSRNILIASHEVRVEPADEFRLWLKTKLNGINT